MQNLPVRGLTPKIKPLKVRFFSNFVSGLNLQDEKILLFYKILFLNSRFWKKPPTISRLLARTKFEVKRKYIKKTTEFPKNKWFYYFIILLIYKLLYIIYYYPTYVINQSSSYIITRTTEMPMFYGRWETNNFRDTCLKAHQIGLSSKL